MTRQHIVGFALGVLLTSVVTLLLARTLNQSAFASQGSAANANSQRASGPPPRWDYRVLRDYRENQLEREANRLGDQGFEVVSFEVIQQVPGAAATAGPAFVMVLKRSNQY